MDRIGKSNYWSIIIEGQTGTRILVTWGIRQNKMNKTKLRERALSLLTSTFPSWVKMASPSLDLAAVELVGTVSGSASLVSIKMSTIAARHGSEVVESLELPISPALHVLVGGMQQICKWQWICGASVGHLWGLGHIDSRGGPFSLGQIPNSKPSCC